MINNIQQKGAKVTTLWYCLNHQRVVYLYSSRCCSKIAINPRTKYFKPVFVRPICGDIKHLDSISSFALEFALFRIFGMGFFDLKKVG